MGTITMFTEFNDSESIASKHIFNSAIINLTILNSNFCTMTTMTYDTAITDNNSYYNNNKNDL